MGANKFCVEKILCCGFENFCFKNDFEHNLGKKKCCVQKLCAQKGLGQKMWVKNILVQKIRSNKLCLNKIFDPK